MACNAKRRRGWKRAPGTHAKVMQPAFCHRVPELFNGEIERAIILDRIDRTHAGAMTWAERNAKFHRHLRRESGRTFRKDMERHQRLTFFSAPVDRL